MVATSSAKTSNSKGNASPSPELPVITPATLSSEGSSHMIPFSEFPLLRTVVNAAVSRLRSAGLPEGAAGDDFGRLAFLSFFRDRSYDPAQPVKPT